jgi:hypothetical protein
MIQPASRQQAVERSAKEPDIASVSNDFTADCIVRVALIVLARFVYDKMGSILLNAIHSQ